jgi:ABC-type lipoprotein export system ATPase subunit
VVGIVGPNGTGKTTLFNLIAELDTPDSGELKIGEVNVGVVVVAVMTMLLIVILSCCNRPFNLLMFLKFVLKN